MRTQQAGNGTAGFTLIEMSIVLVIVGLIIGGVLVGRDLIVSANLNKAIAEVQAYQTATNTFRGKYGYFPGDLPNAIATFALPPGASQQWNCQAVTLADGSRSGVCNGNGNGLIDGPLTSGITTQGNEDIQFWHHLELSGLIAAGGFTGMANGGASWDGQIPGVNIPSIFNGGGLTIANLGANSYYWPNNFVSNVDYYGNTLILSRQCPNLGLCGNPWSAPGMGAPLFTAQEAQKLDAKVDDGLPSGGRIRAPYPWTIAGCTKSTYYVGSTDHDVYNLDGNTGYGTYVPGVPYCVVAWMNVF